MSRKRPKKTADVHECIGAVVILVNGLFDQGRNPLAVAHACLAVAATIAHGCDVPADAFVASAIRYYHGGDVLRQLDALTTTEVGNA